MLHWVGVITMRQLETLLLLCVCACVCVCACAHTHVQMYTVMTVHSLDDIIMWLYCVCVGQVE